MSKPTDLSGWGRYPRAACRLHRVRDQAGLARLVADGPVIARGMGRAYGDAALNSGSTLDMRGLNRMLDFDPETGRLCAEAGVALGDIIATFLPRGWFPAVTPGTKFVTLGGMIAADVHGKNHHVDGSVGRFVDWIDIMVADGSLQRCSRTENPDLFDRTLGGMGLTGVIVRAAMRLRRVETGWIRQNSVICRDLDAVMEAFEAARDTTYSVAWIDCLARGAEMGRSVLMLGEHAVRGELAERDRPFDIRLRRTIRLPLDLPAGVLNAMAARAFNAVYYRAAARSHGHRIVDWDRFFYPLDAVQDWNRAYGRRGFVQYQCVIPTDRAAGALRYLLGEIAGSGQGAFLAVLKLLGEQRGGISFPMPGYTLALDFPASTGALDLLDRLDPIVTDHGGRFYLAKDARLTARTLASADSRTASFGETRLTLGEAGRFQSQLSNRLGI